MSVEIQSAPNMPNGTFGIQSVSGRHQESKISPEMQQKFQQMCQLFMQQMQIKMLQNMIDQQQHQQGVESGKGHKGHHKTGGCGGGGGDNMQASMQEMMDMQRAMLESMQVAQGGGGGGGFEPPKIGGGAPKIGGDGGGGGCSMETPLTPPPTPTEPSPVTQDPVQTQAPPTGETSAGGAPAGMPGEQWEAAKEAAQATGMDPYVLAAQAKQETNFGANQTGVSGGDGVWQAEPSTRAAYASKFQEKFGHSYDHDNLKDQAKMGALIVTSKGGDDMRTNLMKYNGGDNYQPGVKDSYGRPIMADQYADKVMSMASEMRQAGGA